ncbi:MAG: STAS domain-containing protein [Chloroflexota bacterium]|jgi:anti-sigma B factor antagonist
MLDITVDNYKRVDMVTVSGRVDGSNAAELESAFMALTDEGRYQIVAELSGVEYMSSAGLRALVATMRECKKHRGDLRLATPSERINEVLELAGLDSIFLIFDDPAAAVGSF